MRRRKMGEPCGQSQPNTKGTALRCVRPSITPLGCGIHSHYTFERSAFARLWGVRKGNRLAVVDTHGDSQVASNLIRSAGFSHTTSNVFRVCDAFVGTGDDCSICLQPAVDQLGFGLCAIHNKRVARGKAFRRYK